MKTIPLVFLYLKVKVYHYRIDQTHSNSYEVWKKMGSPESPTARQYRTLEKAGQLEELTPVKQIKTSEGNLALTVRLPRQAVSLIRIRY